LRDGFICFLAGGNFSDCFGAVSRREGETYFSLEMIHEYLPDQGWCSFWSVFDDSGCGDGPRRGLLSFNIGMA
jgi:hypothetical protein